MNPYDRLIVDFSTCLLRTRILPPLDLQKLKPPMHIVVAALVRQQQKQHHTPHHENHKPAGRKPHTTHAHNRDHWPETYATKILEPAEVARFFMNPTKEARSLVGIEARSTASVENIFVN